MTATLVHSEVFSDLNFPSTFTPSAAPTPGNVMVLGICGQTEDGGPTALTGWTALSPVQKGGGVGNFAQFIAFYRVAQIGDASWNTALLSAVAHANFLYSEWSGVGALDTSAYQTEAGSNGFVFSTGGALTVNRPALIVGLTGMTSAATNAHSFAPVSPNTELFDSNFTGRAGYWVGYQMTAGAGTFTVNGTATTATGPQAFLGVSAAFVSVPAPGVW